MSNQENNKMIAEFMGYENVGTLNNPMYDYYDNYFEDGIYKVDDLQYHKSWNWLMPVVEKIESLGYSYDRINADVFINTQEGKNIIPNPMDGNTMTMLQKTYNALVEFINQYNKNK